MGTVISFINLKGGVGKTTCCANIAAELVRENRKVQNMELRSCSVKYFK